MRTTREAAATAHLVYVAQGPGSWKALEYERNNDNSFWWKLNDYYFKWKIGGGRGRGGPSRGRGMASRGRGGARGGDPPKLKTLEDSHLLTRGLEDIKERRLNQAFNNLAEELENMEEDW